MKVLLIIVVLVVLAIPVMFTVLGVMSRSGSAPGLQQAKLAACPASPNCVCSEYDKDTAHYISPLPIASVPASVAMETLTQLIKDMGGQIVKQQAASANLDSYIAATFKSKLFGFVDDLELRVDSSNHLLHIRSASRVGQSDLGVNRKRVQALFQQFQHNLNVAE